MRLAYAAMTSLCSRSRVQLGSPSWTISDSFFHLQFLSCNFFWDGKSGHTLHGVRGNCCGGCHTEVQAALSSLLDVLRMMQANPLFTRINHFWVFLFPTNLCTLYPCTSSIILISQASILLLVLLPRINLLPSLSSLGHLGTII